jgi:hypothetical protein
MGQRSPLISAAAKLPYRPSNLNTNTSTPFPFAQSRM